MHTIADNRTEQTGATRDISERRDVHTGSQGRRHQRFIVHRKALSIPELAIISGTRAALGGGVGLLAAGLLNNDQRKAVGWTLLAVGVITTIPILAQLAGSPDHAPSASES